MIRMRWFLFVLVVLPFSHLAAQQTEGVVVDAVGGGALRGATVLLTPPGTRVATDAGGGFLFPGVPAPGAVITVTHIGYARQQVRLDTVRSGRLVIRLMQISMEGPEVEIVGQRAVERYSPVTFADIPQSTLQERYMGLDAPVMLADLPSSTFYSESGNGIGYTYLRIRGFDQRRLAVMVNGIPQNEPEDHNVYWLDFADLLGSASEVQVQRGGGNSLYGPPAMGGSINIVTGDFADRKGISVSTGIGSYGTRRSSFAVGSGLVDDRYVFFGRLSTIASDGYRERSDSRFSAYYLSATRYDPRFTTRLIAYGGPLEDGLAYTGLPRFAIGDRELRRRNYNYWEADADSFTYVQQRRPQEREQFSQPHLELHNEWSPSGTLSVHSSVFLVRGTGWFDYDATGWTDAAYFRMTPEFGFDNVSDPINPIIRAYVDNTQLGWLPRVTWAHDGGRLTFGGEIRSHRSLHWGRIQWAEGLPANLDPDRRYYEYKGGKDVASAHVQEMYELTSAITIMGNVNLVHSRYRLWDEAFAGNDFTVGYNFVNPGLGVNLNLAREWNVYASINRVQREPRLKNLYDAAESSGGATPQFATRTDGSYDVSRPLVTPEEMTDIELGAGWAHGGFRLLLNGFLMDFRNEIVKSGQLDRFGQPVTGNAPRSLHLGLEATAFWQVLPTLDLNANFTMSRDRLEDYAVWDVVDGTPVVTNLAGNRIAGFPELLANAMVTWRLGGFRTSLQWKHVGRQYTDNTQSEAAMVDASDVFSLSMGLRLEGLAGVRGIEARLNVINLFDTLYAQAGEGDQYFPAAERNLLFDIAVDL